MASAHHSPDEPPAHLVPRSSVGRLAHAVRRDPVLLGAFLLVGIVLVYQLVVTLLRPIWVSAVTDWLRAGLAWPALLVVVLVGWHLTRLAQPAARSWWLLSIAFLSYAIARTFWTIDDRFLFPNRVPFPTYPDLFFFLQHPFFLLALLLLPGVPPSLRGRSFGGVSGSEQTASRLPPFVCQARVREESVPVARLALAPASPQSVSSRVGNN